MIQIFEYTGTPKSCTRALEEFFTQLVPQKPKRNHMVMIAEHLISAFRGEHDVQHKISCEIDVDAGTISFSMVLQNET